MFKNTIEDLKEVLPNLDARGQEFANSLISRHTKYGKLSDKQFFWVDKLVAQVLSPQPKIVAANVGSLDKVVALLKNANKHLKHPAIVLRANERDLRLNIAGSKAKVPGSINVCGLGGFDDRDWYGRVSPEGEFQPSQKYNSETVTAISLALKALAVDPAGAALAYSKLTGNCCFCGLELTDEKSTSVGYGPVCASNWGLPYPTDKQVKAAKAKKAA